MIVAPDRVYNLVDDFCIVVEFQNENNSVAAGYASWTKTEFNREQLQEILNQHPPKLIDIYWPNGDFNTGAKIKTFIKNLPTDQWSIHAVRIMAVSDWKNVNSMVQSLKKNNILTTTRKNRHAYMKKKFPSDEEDNALSVAEANKIEKHKAKETKKNKKEAASQRNTHKVDELKKKLEKKKWTDELDLSSEDDDIRFDKYAGKDQLKIRIQILEMENKNLRSEVAHYKNAVLLDEKVQNLNALFKTVDYVVANGQLCSKCRKRKITDHDSESSGNIPQFKKPRMEIGAGNASASTLKPSEDIEASKIFDDDLDFTTVEEEFVAPAFDGDIQQEEVGGISRSLGGNELPPPKNSASSPVATAVTSTSVPVQIESNHDENMMELTHGVKITTSIFSEKIRKSKLRFFLLDMTIALFEESVWQTSSRSGKKGPKLDENKLLAIAEKAKEIFPAEKDVVTTLHTIVDNRCKNAKRGNKAVKGEESKE